jgi:lacticin-481/lactococcin-DR transport/processing ATP-binding protein lcnDR3
MQNQSVDWYLNVYDNIYMGVLYSKNTISKKSVDEIIEVLGLKDKEKSDLTELSGGQLQRVQIARSLISDSKILFLDEPTTGLDVVLSKNILEYIKNNNKEHAVFISSHDLDLIEKYCNKIIYINDGECLYFGEMSTFLKEYNKEIVYNISYSGEINKNVVEKHKDTITIIDDKNLKIFLEKEEEISNVLKLLLAENITIGSLRKEEITLKRILELEE